MSSFQIYGDYGYENEALINEFDTQAEAEERVRMGIEQEEFEEFRIVEVAYFAEDGEYVVCAAWYPNGY
mgnify:CR=1 FL=1